MATKLKKPKPVLTFTVFFLSFTIFWIACLGALGQCESLSLDYKRSESYVERTIPTLIQAGYAYTRNMTPLTRGGETISSANAIKWPKWAQNILATEGDNLAYLMINTNGESIANGTSATTPEAFMAEFQQELTRSRSNYNRFMAQASSVGYDHLIILRGNTLYEAMNNRLNGFDERTVRLTNTIYQSSLAQETFDEINTLSETDAVFCLAIRAEGNLINNYGQIYWSYYDWFVGWAQLLVFVFVALACLLICLGSRLKKQNMDIARAKIASFSGWFWVECKAICGILTFFYTFMILDAWWYPEGFLALLPAFWAFWILGNDLHYNGTDVFHHNSFRSLKTLLLRLDSQYPFCARMKRRPILLVIAELLLFFLCAFLVALLGGFGVFLGLFLVATGIALLVIYLKTYLNDVDDFGKIVAYVSRIRLGDATEPMQIAPEHAFSPLAADLNDIHSGMTHMVEERVRSEQMKVELITNVSHDLKTPLTSIINYVDLLSKETLSPEYANEYVHVLEGKTQRLKNLVQDLFEISKASSGSIDLNLEQLCVCSLVEQTVAELDPQTIQAGVEIKLRICQPPVIIRADGKKLHRVFENLLGNALKYSLPSTRVYIDVTKEEASTQIIIKNVAGYEMNFTAEDIVERFQRGDASRTSEGSGLGLAIAKSFLELNGGSLEIELDGDLFKAIVCLPLFVPYQQRSTVPETPPQSQLQSESPTQPVIISKGDVESPCSPATSPLSTETAPLTISDPHET